MRSIRVLNITKHFNNEVVLDDVTLTIPGGTFFALLGPSGSGKTTLLRLIGGFETPDHGSIWLDNQDITYQPIHERRINTVFQQYALFPHLNVFDNIAYGLRIVGLQEDIVQQKVKKIITTMHLEKQMYRSPDQLSGGQQQRVALARAVVTGPDVLLLDEPLAALDLKLREKMLLELIDLQSTLGTTFIYVTHDQMEALTVADCMAIMNDGRIEQVGTPKTVYEDPLFSFVAQFVGTTNLFRGTIDYSEEKIFINIVQLGRFEVMASREKKWPPGTLLYMSVRPEKIAISKIAKEGFSNKLQAVVVGIVYHGRSTQYNVRLNNGSMIQIFEQNEEHFPKEVIDYDDNVYLYWQKENAVLLER
jgi:spermidine/putrescine transport system ATP-binding protein